MVVFVSASNGVFVSSSSFYNNGSNIVLQKMVSMFKDFCFIIISKK